MLLSQGAMAWADGKGRLQWDSRAAARAGFEAFLSPFLPVTN